MTEDFNLSKKIHLIQCCLCGDTELRSISIEDVKEFIRQIKIRLFIAGETNSSTDADSHLIYTGEVYDILDELSGDKLI